MKKILNTLLALVITIVTIETLQAKKGGEPAGGANPNGALYYDGEMVGTVATPTSMPFQGVDVIYVIIVDGEIVQPGITTVAPGDPNYHGGRWAVYAMHWIGAGDPPLFTSQTQVLNALDDGDLMMVRAGEADFVCPVLING